MSSCLVNLLYYLFAAYLLGDVFGSLLLILTGSRFSKHSIQLNQITNDANNLLHMKVQHFYTIGKLLDMYVRCVSVHGPGCCENPLMSLERVPQVRWLITANLFTSNLMLQGHQLVQKNSSSLIDCTYLHF